MKIYYFTGTGNSLYVAKKISECVKGAVLEPVARSIKNDKVEIDGDAGFVFPLYFSGMPKIMHEFLDKAVFKKGAYIFAVVTAGIPATGAALSQMNALLKKKGVKLNAGFYVKMIDNYLINFNMPDKEAAVKNVGQIERKAAIIGRIASDRRTHKKYEVSLLSGLISKPFLKKVNSLDKNFYYTGNCNSCGTCKKVCPVDNISMDKKENRPVWNNNCQLCLACIHLCPKMCIHYGKKTLNRVLRYRNPNIKISEIIAQKT